MKKTPKTTPEEEYLAAAVEFQRARDEYDHKKSNKAHDKLISAARKIRLSRSDQGQLFFSSLVSHDMPHVRAWAAFNLIPLNPKLASKVLSQLAKGPPGEVRLDAEMTLKEWKAGRLDPDWFMKH